MNLHVEDGSPVLPVIIYHGGFCPYPPKRQNRISSWLGSTGTIDDEIFALVWINIFPPPCSWSGACSRSILLLHICHSYFAAAAAAAADASKLIRLTAASTAQQLKYHEQSVLLGHRISTQICHRIPRLEINHLQYHRRVRFLHHL